jgi:hypothetical protein
MKKNNFELSNGIIETILDENYDLTFWYHQLGVFSDESQKDDRNYFSKNNFDQGIKYYERVRDKVYGIICDPEQGKPKSTIQKSIDRVDLIAEIVSTLVQNNFPVAVAICLAGILTKKGLAAFCRRNVGN